MYENKKFYADENMRLAIDGLRQTGSGLVIVQQCTITPPSRPLHATRAALSLPYLYSILHVFACKFLFSKFFCGSLIFVTADSSTRRQLIWEIRNRKHTTYRLKCASFLTAKLRILTALPICIPSHHDFPYFTFPYFTLICYALSLAPYGCNFLLPKQRNRRDAHNQ